MTTVFKPIYYETPQGLTNATTIIPVSSSEFFYQERQQGNLCVLHSLNAFAGKAVINFSHLAKFNNDWYVKKFDKDTARRRSVGLPADPYIQEMLDKYHLIHKIEDLITSVKNALDIYIVSDYINQNKQLFHLPREYQVKVFVIPSVKMPLPKEVEDITRDSSVDRLIVSGPVAGERHFFVIRKDKSMRWRIIDSWDRTHKASKNLIDQLQPAYDTLQEAFDKHIDQCQAYFQNALILYPTQDVTTQASFEVSTPNVSEKVTPLSKDPAATRASFGNYLVHCWNWIIMKLRQLFACLCLRRC